MDDKRLQNEFDGYFRGAELPENLTADAKAQIKPRKKRGSVKWFLRLTPVAALLVAVVTAATVLSPRYLPGGNTVGGDGSFGDHSAGSTPPGAGYEYYSLSELAERDVDPYETVTRGLEFARTFAFAKNADVSVTEYSKNDTVRIARADVALVNNGFRHDAVIYAEYTDGDARCRNLLEYADGEENYYRGTEYILNTEYDNGENVYKLFIDAGTVKYYLRIKTSQSLGYTYYFDILGI